MSDQQPHESGSQRSRREIREARELELAEQRALEETLRTPRARSAASAGPAVERDEPTAADPGAAPSPASLPTIAPVQGSVIFNQEYVSEGKLEREDTQHADPHHPDLHPVVPATGDDPDSEPTAPSAVTPFDQVLSPDEADYDVDYESDVDYDADYEYALAEESDFPLEDDLEDDYYEGTRIAHDDDGTPLLISSSSHGRSYQTVSGVEGGATQAVLEKRRTRRRRRNLTLSVAFGLFAALLVGFVVVLQSLFGGGGPEDFETQAGEVVEFTVEEGDGPALVRNRLLEAGIIASDDAFDDAFAALDGAPELQPGEFQLREQMPAADALAVIFEEGEALHYISLQDNTRIDAALSSIAAQTGIPESDIGRAAADPGAYGLPDEAETLEGYLAAGEYQPSLEATPEEILQQMVDTTFERLEELGITEEDEQWRTVIVASLLTAEGLPGDYEEIAGIIENRLAPNNSETDGLLQIDATVIYGLGTQSVHFTEEERADASNEYNTYQNPGLPPGPVAAPNMATLEAAANPEENDYFYWVTVDLETGETKFAEDYEEHLGYVEEFNAYCEDNAEICDGEPTQENAGP
ncbi:endolytic transglycosylase MltG [Nesterenkonia sp. AY15]|uniref:endolytic transglycosylase MltG n=1 Tax=Nesterenkonia sp. AY15 TaxID=2901139 RepID=UPI001F4D0D84|nr:endolytic transglycosylase MltG [Nesterenkonia sp. AY15]